MSQVKINNQKTLPFLLEIGSEEIPARFVPNAMEYLEKAVAKELENNYLNWQSLRVVATPRRMALLVEGLSAAQPDRDVEIKGPPVSVAFDAEGKATRAAEGFAKKVGMSLDECGRGEDKRGEFLLACRTEKGLSAAEVLKRILPGVILGVPFRKTMKWANHELEYARPLQWLVALLGAEVVPVEVGYLKAGRQTRGHRTLSSDKRIDLLEPSEYFSRLLEVRVVADHLERRKLIKEGLVKTLKQYDPEAQLLEDDELLTEVVFLCEYPTPFLGSYGVEYLDLPDQVVTTAMKSHQKYFSVEKINGQGLKPRFAAVRCGGSDFLENIVAGNERVLRARLADALFYWNFDQKKSPDERTKMLETVTWMEGYGSVFDKTKRMASLCLWLWDNGWSGTESEKEAMQRAVQICKSDLVSEMIKDGKEFTKLEGFIGARYAELAGESAVVCEAIEQHFLPKSATGDLPSGLVSSLLSFADRVDNVTGCWLAGFIPTGAKDPYALRRHVLAALRILLDQKVHLDLENVVARGLEQFGSFSTDRDANEVAEQINDFIKTRIFGYFVENLGRDPEVVRAVIPVRWRDPSDALEWVDALNNYRDREDFKLLATGFKRCRNILKGEILPVSELGACFDRWSKGGSGSRGESFVQMPQKEEKELCQQVGAAAFAMAKAENKRDYDEVFALLSSLGPAIDQYFEEVRVNAEDENLKILRHAFIREIHGIFVRYADFAVVAPQEN